MRRSKSRLQSFTRRDFLRFSGGCAALSSAPLLSTLLGLQMTKAAVAATHSFPGYKALVCVFLAGGNDSFNMLVPREAGEYNEYATVRDNLALQKQQLLPISDTSGRQFGLHPQIPELANLYAQGKLAFLANTGSLLAPTTLAGFENNKQSLPTGLFSHSDQQKHWQTSIPQSRQQLTGWAGRMADAITDTVNARTSVPMNIALDSTNILQTGDTVVPYVVGTRGATQLSGYGGQSPWTRMLTGVTDGMLDQPYEDLLAKTHAQRRRVSIDAAIQFNSATSGITIKTQFPGSALGAQLGLVAKAIAARSGLGQSRQIFFVTSSSWDDHSNLLPQHGRRLAQLSAALKAFSDATTELGVENDVTTFTISEFGRTLTSNGDGSDHGWGGNQIVMGGSVSGGQIYGEYPSSLALGNPLDTGRGRLIPTTSVDEYSAELATWFGVSNNASLERILPNIRNFYASGVSQRPIGFLT